MGSAEEGQHPMGGTSRGAGEESDCEVISLSNLMS